MPALLIECAFCDSESNMNGYDCEKMAGAIFDGICKMFDIDNNIEEKLNEIRDENLIYVGQDFRIK